MKIQKAIKFRIYPNDKQKEWFNDCFRITNFIYNYFLGEQKEYDLWLQACGIGDKAERNKLKRDHFLYFFKLGKRVDGEVVVQAPYNVLSNLAKTEQYSFLNNYPSTSRNYALTSLDEAFKKMYKEGSGFPRFKKASDLGSFTLQKSKNSKFNIVRKGDKGGKWGILNIAAPNSLKKKVKNIKINLGKGNEWFLDNYSEIKINSYTISNDVKGHYYISIQMEIEKDILTKKELSSCNVIGIDMGVVRPITTSNSIDFDNELYSNRIENLKKLQKEKAIIEQSLANKRLTNPKWKESKKYIREKKKLSAIHKKISNKRKDIQHNISNSLVNDITIDIIGMEKLNLKGMTKKSSKGLSNKKKGLTKALLDVGIYEIQRQIEYKAEWLEKRVIKIDPKYTSQTCSECGCVDSNNREKQDVFKCVECGHTENADLNAAKNIKEKVIKIIEEKGEKAFD